MLQPIQLPTQPKVIKKENNLAVFEISPLQPGYGHTLGNALRRVLFSSLPGSAATMIKIEGVNHEFSSIPNVMEDVIEIMLNVKKIRFKLHSDEPQRISLSAKGEKEIKAGDLKLPSQVEIISKDARIATLTDKKAALEMEIVVESGLGYSPVESRQKEKLEIGALPLDALFTPVRKVNYVVENMRVGERTDYNRLILDIATDGSISPEEALIKASAILVDQFSVLVRGIESEEKEEIEKKAPQASEISKQDLSVLGLPNRIVILLGENKIKTIGGLLRKKKSVLREIEGLGEKGLKEIEGVLDKIGLFLKE